MEAQQLGHQLPPYGAYDPQGTGLTCCTIVQAPGIFVLILIKRQGGRISAVSQHAEPLAASSVSPMAVIHLPAAPLGSSPEKQKRWLKSLAPAPMWRPRSHVALGFQLAQLQALQSFGECPSRLKICLSLPLSLWKTCLSYINKETFFLKLSKVLWGLLHRLKIKHTVIMVQKLEEYGNKLLCILG